MDSPDLQYYDRLIDSLCANGLATLGLIDYSTVADVSWRPNGEIFPEYLEKFKRITTILVNYYGDRIKAWELWNEPDSVDTDLQPAEFTELLVETSPIIQDAGDWVVFGGLVSPDNTSRDYLAAIYTALRDNHNNAATPFDIFAIHPYPSEQYVDANGKRLLHPNDFWLAESPTVFDKFHNVLLGIDNDLDRNDSNKDIWVTEFGWNSAKGSQADNDDACPAVEELWVTAGEQEYYLARGLDILFKDTTWPGEDRQSITKAFWFQYRDFSIRVNGEENCVEWPDRSSFSWYLSYMYYYLFGPPVEGDVDIPFSFGLYNGWENETYQPKAGVLCAFKEYPDWPQACYNYDYQVFLPLINAEAAASAAGE